MEDLTMNVTHISFKNAPEALRVVLARLGIRKDLKIEARERVIPTTTSQVYTCANALVADLDNPDSATVRYGAWGGDNGFNRPPLDRTFDPVFDREQREVPVGGAIVVAQKDKIAWVYVHPTTFAERFARNEIAADALLEGRLHDAREIQSEADALTEQECAILYAHYALKSCDTRKAVVRTFPDALESCVKRGLIRRSKNGACAITVEGKAREQSWRKVGESVAWKCR